METKIAVVGQWLVAFALAVGPTAIISKLLPVIQFPLLLLIYVWTTVALKCAGTWILSRKFPVSGAELRQRKKDFYDSLRR